jgi:hypothetical protein
MIRASGSLRLHCPLDLARGEQAVGVTIDQQRQHHVGRELLLPGAPVVDAKALQREALHRLDHEMDQVVLRHPIPQVGRQQHWRVAVNGNKSCTHRDDLPIVGRVQSPTGSQALIVNWIEKEL